MNRGISMIILNVTKNQGFNLSLEPLSVCLLDVFLIQRGKSLKNLAPQQYFQKQGRPVGNGFYLSFNVYNDLKKFIPTPVEMSIISLKLQCKTNGVES